MGTIRFIIRGNRINKKGKAPIDMIYSVHGQRKFYRTKLKLYPVNWNEDSQEAVTVDKISAKKNAPMVNFDLLLNSKETRDVKTKLETYRNQVQDIERYFEANSMVYTSQMVKDKLSEKKREGAVTRKDVTIKPDAVLSFVDSYIERNPNSHSKGTLKVFGQLRQHLSAMVQERKNEGKKAVTFENMDLEFMEDFQNFLTETRGLANITTAKQVSILKSLLKYARLKKEKVNQDYKDFKIIKVKDADVVALTENELALLLKMDLCHSRRLDKVRDAFCFACATGLRYSDLAQLRSEHIYANELRLNSIKTGEHLIIPLTPISRAILGKYNGMLRPLPIISDQKMNSTLKGWTTKDKKGVVTHFKGLCELAGINTPTEKVRIKGAERIVTVQPKYELVSVHTSRRTFVSLSLQKGMSAQEVMKMTGHKSYKSFERYVKITEEHQQAAMKKAWNNMAGKAELKVV